MTTGAQTPIAVFSLGLGPLIGAAASGVSSAASGISAAAPAIVAGVEGASAAVPAAVAAAEGASALAPSAVAAAEMIGTSGPMIANVMSGVGPAVAEGAASAAPAVANPLIQMAGEGTQGVTEVAKQIANNAVGSSEGLVASLMEKGPQMSQVPAQVAPSWATPAPNMSTAAGPTYGGAPPTMPSATTVPSTPSSSDAASSWRDNKWLKAGNKALGQLGDELNKGGQESQPQAAPQYTAPPPSDPYSFGQVDAQENYAETIMKEYLASGGVSYGT